MGAEPSAEAFARAVNDRLRSVSPDGHLHVLPSKHPRAVDVHRGRLGIAGTADGARERDTRERRANHFFSGVQILESNVAVIALDQFPGMTAAARRTAEAVMAMVAHADAVIIDLRGNPGGSDGMNQFISSHFLPEAPVVITAREYREGDGQRRTDYPNDPARGGGRLSQVPLFVLVDAATGSAAENMSFSLQGLGRAVIVGETTTGAAHSSQFHPLPHGFAVQVPVARSFNPRTGKDWEGVGVVPDVPADSVDALRTAHRLALDRLAEAASSDDERRALGDVRARLTAPAGPPAVDLPAYAGDYGERYRVAFDEARGYMTIARTERPRALAPLRYLGDDRWAIGDRSRAQVRFERDADGAVTGLRVRETATGSWDTTIHSRHR